MSRSTWVRDTLTNHGFSEADAARVMAEVHAEARALRDAEIIAWLGKKAREYPSSPARQEKPADLIVRLASKISRGAVRPTGGA